MEIIFIIILLVIIILYIKNSTWIQSKMEHIINTDDSRKLELQKCCSGEKCYSKPPFLQNYTDSPNKCNLNKNKMAAILDKSYEQMFTQDKYNTILTDLKIRPNIDNTTIERSNKEINLLQRKIDDISTKIGIPAYNNMILDNTDNVNGFDNIKNIYGSYNNI